MQKVFDIWPIMKEQKLGEYLLGGGELESDKLEIVFGRLKERETDRRLRRPPGKTAFFYVVEGAIRVLLDKEAWTMVEGEAILDPYN